MTDTSRAVFLSYASQDAEAARRIAETLRAAGIEVWLDQSELRGGDVWDQKIRRQVRECALFVPIISANSQQRAEGYFRLEWDIADQRTHLMGRNRAFLVPVCTDATPERDADVPESFQRVQWTRLPGGETSAAFVERVRRLLTEPATTGPPAATTAIAAAPVNREHAARAHAASSARAGWGIERVLLIVLAVGILGAGAYIGIEKLWTAKTAASPSPTPAVVAHEIPAGFSPPRHSIAVLPFVNLSGDKEQEYFSDGLTEELLNSLAEVNELQVAARTSAFSFKGQNTDIATVARKLNVASVLEGSVRRSGHTIRITAQLINATTGFHLWSKTYDRDLGDVLKLQTDIATAVAEALKVTLLGDVGARIELGGTHSPAAFDAYLRATKMQRERRDAKDTPAAIAGFTEAIRLDPKYALAYVGRSLALTIYAGEETGAEMREDFKKSEADAREAIALAPDLGPAHTALGAVLQNPPFDFAQAREEHERALALAPGNAQVLRAGAEYFANMGHFDAAIGAARRDLALDPLDRRTHAILGEALYVARRYGEAIGAFSDAIRINPAYTPSYANRGLVLIGLGEWQSARSSCETHRDHWQARQCLAVVYDKLGRHSDAEAELARMKADLGDGAAYQYATMYAQWGDRAKALDWLDTAVRLRDPGLVGLKVDPLMDPLRQEPRFQKVLRELKFPD